MQRDMNLCRDILRKIAESESEWVPIRSQHFSNISIEKCSAHVSLLKDAGLIEGNQYLGGGATVKLTWNGNEFWELSQNDSIWTKVIDGLTQKGIALSFDIIKKALADQYSQMF